MRTELGLLAAIGVIAGLGLLASSGPPPAARGSLVLERQPQPASSPLALDWGAWPPRAAAAYAQGQRVRQASVPPSQDDAEAPKAGAGIWATPAEFAASD